MSNYDQCATIIRQVREASANFMPYIKWIKLGIIVLFLLISLPTMLIIGEIASPNMYGNGNVNDLETYKKNDKKRKIVQACMSILMTLITFIILYLLFHYFNLGVSMARQNGFIY